MQFFRWVLITHQMFLHIGFICWNSEGNSIRSLLSKGIVPTMVCGMLWEVNTFACYEIFWFENQYITFNTNVIALLMSHLVGRLTGCCSRIYSTDLEEVLSWYQACQHKKCYNNSKGCKKHVKWLLQKSVLVTHFSFIKQSKKKRTHHFFAKKYNLKPV